MNSQYRFYCERIIRKLMEHYKDNLAVIGWQVDNETSAAGAANPDVQAGFAEVPASEIQDCGRDGQGLGTELLGPADL